MRAFVIIGVASMPRIKKPDETSTYLAVTVGIVGIDVLLQPFYHGVNNTLETFV